MSRPAPSRPAPAGPVGDIKKAAARRWAHPVSTVALAVTAAGLGYGWYAERQWEPERDPSVLADTSCTIAADILLSVSFTQGPGDVISVRVVSDRDRVRVGFRSEPVDDGPRTAMATSGTYSVVLRSGLRDRHVVLADGTELRCKRVPLPGRDDL